MVVKWKGHIQAGVATGEFMTMEDWVPTIMSWVGDNIVSELRAGKKIGDRTYKVHLYGYDQSDLLLRNGQTKRKEFYYFTETTFHGMRYGDWKVLIRRQDKWFRATQETTSTPMLVNLKLDPFERFTEARGYDEWAENRGWTFGLVGPKIAEFVATFKEFPPSQKSNSVQVEDMAKMIAAQGGGR